MKCSMAVRTVLAAGVIGLVIPLHAMGENSQRPSDEESSVYYSATTKEEVGREHPTIELDSAKVSACRKYRDKCLEKLPSMEAFVREYQAEYSAESTESAKREYWKRQSSCYVWDPYLSVDTLTGEISRGLARPFYLLPDFDYCDCLSRGEKDCYQRACDLACKKENYKNGITAGGGWRTTDPGPTKGWNLEDTMCGVFADGRKGMRLIIPGQYEATSCLCQPCEWSRTQAPSEETLFGFTFDGEEKVEEPPLEDQYDDFE